MSKKEFCENIKNAIIEKNTLDANYNFRIIYNIDKYIDIEPSNKLNIKCNEDFISFFNDNELIKKINIEDICGLCLVFNEGDIND